MKTKMIIIVLLLAGMLLGAVFAVTAAAAPEATITVDSTADTLVAGDNECTLREAINNANTDSDTTGGDCMAGNGADVIDLPAGTYTLTIPGGDENNNATGDLDILDSLTINGSGALSTMIDGNDLDRVLHVQGAANQVILNDLTVANGLSTLGTRVGGGGIYNEDATLTLNDCIVRDNTVQGTASALGGGLFNVAGLVTLNGTTVQNNTISSTGLWGGGGLANLATMYDATMILNSSVVAGNDAPGGGGINSYAGSNVTATLSISRSMIISNVAGPTDGIGGGIWTSYEVGAVNHRTILTIQESTIAENEVTGIVPIRGVGGGLYAINSDVFIVSTTFMSNSAASTASPGGLGGGLTIRNSNATIVNSTISGNTATGNALIDNGIGGGLALFTNGGSPVTTTLINTTLANNSADEAGGGLWAGEPAGDVDLTVRFVNVLLANNLAPAGQGSNCMVSYGPPEFVSLGHNLEDDDTCEFDQPSDQVNTDPLLGPLQDNGGPTWTHALLDFSPAIDAGDDAVCAAAPVNGVDQRGVGRPIGPHCDIGAFESAAMPPIPQFDVYLPVVLKP